MLDYVSIKDKLCLTVKQRGCFMVEEIKEQEEKDKRIGSVYLDSMVWKLLETKSKELGRSKSWLANLVLRERLGLPPDDGFNPDASVKDVL